MIYYKPEALPGRSGSSLFNESGTKVVGLVAWRTGDRHGLAMNAARVRAFVRGEVSEAESELPDDAIPLRQSRVRLVLVTSHGCQPCKLQKQSMPVDVRYETVDIRTVNAKGYNVRVTSSLMVFVDNQLKHTASGLLRGDRLQAFVYRWGFSNRNEEDQPNDADLSDDLKRTFLQSEQAFRRLHPRARAKSDIKEAIKMTAGKVDHRILAAVRQLALASASTDNRTRFINLWSSLETLAGAHEGENAMERVRELVVPLVISRHVHRTTRYMTILTQRFGKDIGSHDYGSGFRPSKSGRLRLDDMLVTLNASTHSAIPASPVLIS